MLFGGAFQLRLGGSEGHARFINLRAGKRALFEELLLAV